MEINLRASEHSYDFDRPMTVSALAMFDPDLRLVLNKRYELFQVMRVRNRYRKFWSPTIGNICFIEPVLIWVVDWKQGLEHRDDPRPLIHELWECDVLRHPKLMKERRELVEKNAEQARKTVKDNYRHALLDNWRILQKAFEPLVNSPGLVN